MSVNMKMIQQMQNRLAKIQTELAETVVEGTAGGGVVTAQVTGQREFQGIKIDPSAVDPDDVEMLEDLITAAVQDAMAKATALAEEDVGPDRRHEIAWLDVARRGRPTRTSSAPRKVTGDAGRTARIADWRRGALAEAASVRQS